MGKSPGKWIKTVLFGKKSSKSRFSKDVIVAKAPSGDSAVNPPVIPDLPPQTTDRSGLKTQLEKGLTTNLPCNAVVLLPEKQGEDASGIMGLSSANNAERARQEQAATKAQTAFRGFLARRAFWALKGIIRLQALVRGHLVRRQAVATLRCMLAIIKFQALARGHMVRLSAAGHEVRKKCCLGEPLDAKQMELSGGNSSLRSEKLSTNAFVSKLLGSCSTAMPLSLQYDLVEPNSVWSWLELWSSSRFWEPLAQPKQIVDAKPQRKQAKMQFVEIEGGRPKRGVRKVSTTNGDNNILNSSEYEKPKRNLRKVLSHQADSVQEQPQNELERVKRNLRKVTASAAMVSDKSEVVTEKPQHSQRNASSSPVDISEHGMDNSSEKMNDLTVTESKQAEVETPSKPLAVDEPVGDLHDDHPAVELHSLDNSGKVENNATLNEESSFREDQSTKENQRTRRRRSFPAKQEYPENVSQNTQTLPSYMAATESAKAKLRAQSSPMFGEEGNENGSIRRHSLPSSTNGKLSSSPRIQRPVQANGKGGSKSNKSLLSSGDGTEKVLQAGWRR